LSRTARWIPILLVAILFLGWRTYRAWTEPVLPGEPVPREGSVLLPGPAYPEPAGGGDSAAYAVAVIQARPLFRPDRSPYQENGAILPGRNYDAELSRFVVLGVLLLGEEQKAVITDKAPGQSNRWEVGAGDPIPGFVVKEVQEDGVLLEANGKIFTLPLYAGAPRSGKTTPVRTETGQPQPPVATQQPETTPSQVRQPAPPFPNRRIYRPGRR